MKICDRMDKRILKTTNKKIICDRERIFYTHCRYPKKAKKRVEELHFHAL